MFIVIDAFPAYRCYGKNKTSKTPNLDKLMKSGTWFEQAISSADFTPTSFGSIFTGLFPFNCAIRGGLWFYKLKPRVSTYIKALKDNGYSMYATLPGITSMQDLYTYFDKHTYDFFSDKLYNELGNSILKKIESIKNKQPWFYFIHLMDAHKPIQYPKEFDSDEYGKDEYDRMVSSIDFWIGKIINKIDLKNTIVIITSDHGDYIRSVKHGDKVISLEHKSLSGTAQAISKITPDFLYSLKIKIFLSIRNLVSKIKLRGIESELSPFEKRNLKYARSKPNHFLFDELIRVPLILSGYNIPSCGSIKQQIRTIDIFPTISEIIELPNLIKNIQGQSFLPLLNRKSLEELPAYIETSLNYKNDEEGGYGLRTSKYKFFRRVPESQKQIHLYDLVNDPYEENNIAENNPKIIQQLEKIIKELKKDIVKIDGKELEKSISRDEKKKIEDELRKMGYI